MSDEMVYDHNDDGIDRRGFLKCMAWAGAGVLLTMRGGILESSALGAAPIAAGQAGGGFTFAQVSDSHIGFNKPANADVVGTFQEAVRRLGTLPARPDFVLHTGDISHLSKPEEFDTAAQVLKGGGISRVFYVPGEHDVLTDEGKTYRERFARDSEGAGWYSFDHKGCHFIGLVNVMNLKAGGMGSLGAEQLEWLERDLKGRSSSTPIVVFAHIPLWTVYPAWGWGTDDSARALSMLRRFGSVSVLNGHIHQTLQKVEGNITFHTACSTAFPQPKPGGAPSPGPMTVPAEQLRRLLGLTSVNVARGNHALAIIDSNLQPSGPAADASVAIDNFAFAPANMVVRRGTTVTWTNRDDIPHIVAGTDRSFTSPVLDTEAAYSRTFSTPGQYDYFCTLHPHMTGRIVVRA